MDISLSQLNLVCCIGSENGKYAFTQVVRLIGSNEPESVLNISLLGIKQIDVSFISSSFVTLMKMYKNEKYLYFTGIENKDILKNMECVAHFHETLFLVKDESNNIQWIGRNLTAKSMELLNFIYSKDKVTTAVIAKKFDLSLPNASLKLKKLFNQGYLIANKQDALSGGHEYIYEPIVKPTYEKENQ